MVLMGIRSLGLLSALLVCALLAPVLGVDAALVGRVEATQALTASKWSIVVNGPTTGSKGITIGDGLNVQFTLTNDGNVNLTAMSLTITGNRAANICNSAVADCTNALRATSLPNNGGTTVPLTTPVPLVGATTTWTIKKTQNGGTAPQFTVSVSVSSANITPAPGTTNS